MVYIPAASFPWVRLDPVATEMFCGGDEPMNAARPIHRVSVDAFFMDATEVTNEEFDRFVKATGM
jgi:formylglycine-generating enzyme required for sulfatase activity